MTVDDDAVDDGGAPVSGAEAHLERMRVALDDFQQRLEVAVSVLPAVAEKVGDEWDRMLVLADVVRRWSRLDPATRLRYQPVGPGLTGLSGYAWEYVDQVVAGAAPAGAARGGDPGTGEPDEVECWERHVAALRDLAEGRPGGFAWVRLKLGEQGRGRPATEAERREFNLAPGSAVLEIRRHDGQVEVCGARAFAVRLRPPASSRRPGYQDQDQR